MSRTFRNTRAIPRYRLFLSVSSHKFCGSWFRYSVTSDSSLNQECLVRFRSDNYTDFQYSAPRQYRHVFEKRFRNYNRREVHLASKTADYEPLCLANHRHSAVAAWREEL